MEIFMGIILAIIVLMLVLWQRTNVTPIVCAGCGHPFQPTLRTSKAAGKGAHRLYCGRCHGAWRTRQVERSAMSRLARFQPRLPAISPLWLLLMLVLIAAVFMFR